LEVPAKGAKRRTEPVEVKSTKKSDAAASDDAAAPADEVVTEEKN
jgi:hypothetical protein